MSHPFVDVALETTRPFQQPRSVTVVQEVGHHDVILFENFETRISARRWRTGAQAQIRFGWMPSNLSEVVAYVFEPRPTSSMIGATSSAARNELTLLGITYPLKERGIGSWTDVPTWWLVEELGRRHRIRTRTDRVGRIRSSTLQRGRSEWEMLTELADEDGLLLFVADNTLHLRDPLKLEEEQRRTALHLSLTNHGHRRLRKIRTEMGELGVDGPSAADFVTTGETADGEQIVATSREQWYRSRGRSRNFLTEYIDTAARSVGEGRARLEDAERRAYFSHKAEIEADGDPLIRPGSGVILHGVGDRAAGYWTVLKAEHRVSVNDYKVVATVGRSATIRLRAIPDPSPIGNRRVLVSEAADYRSTQRRHGVRSVEGRWVTR